FCRQFCQRLYAISTQMGQTNNRLGGTTAPGKRLSTHGREPVARERLLHRQHIDLRLFNVVVASLKRHCFSTPDALDNLPAFLETAPTLCAALSKGSVLM